MATRKKWKLTIRTPGETLVERRATGERDAFRAAGEVLRNSAKGIGAASQVTVYVDEGDGRWQTFEVLRVADFPAA